MVTAEIKIMEKNAKKIVFSGRVQGVGFRFTAYNIAIQYQLSGYVKNLPNGSVEMVAQGRDDDITNCIDDIRQALPDYITDTDIEEIPCNTGQHEFKITF